jgi:hypothetical protein
MYYSCKTFIEKYIAFDFKFQQHTGLHEPNLCCAEDFEEKNYTCQNLDDFCKWLISNKHKDYTAIAHYGNKYDTRLILMIENDGKLEYPGVF